MTKEECVKWLTSELKSVYCDTCYSNSLSEDDPEYCCEECYRKMMNWGISQSEANYIVNKIRGENK